jgi:hypothetical protein
MAKSPLLPRLDAQFQRCGDQITVAGGDAGMLRLQNEKLF